MMKFMAVMGAVAVLALPVVLVTAPASVAADAPGTIGGPVVAAPVPTFDALDTVTAAWMTPSEMGGVAGEGVVTGSLVQVNANAAVGNSGGEAFFGLRTAFNPEILGGTGEALVVIFNNPSQ